MITNRDLNKYLNNFFKFTKENPNLHLEIKQNFNIFFNSITLYIV